MAEKVRKNRFTWDDGSVEIIMPNGKPMKPKSDKKKKPQKKGK